jgi:hypothetical protein
MRLYLIFLYTLISISSYSQAQLKIVNNSKRSLQIKVMSSDGGNGSLYETISINANESKTIFFQESGYYFTKTKAVINGKEPVYEKGKPFEVYNGTDGYSILTLTFSLLESKTPQLLSGKQISKKEFEEN